MKNTVLAALATAVLLGGAAGAWARHRHRPADIVPLSETGAVTTDAEYAKLAGAWEEAYEADAAGSTTPEGTFDLFTAALEKGDTARAAAYFLPEKRRMMEEEFAAGAKNGGIDLLLSAVRKPKTGIDFGDGSYRLRTYDKDGMAEFSFDLVKNQKTGIWKINEL